MTNKDQNQQTTPTAKDSTLELQQNSPAKEKSGQENPNQEKNTMIKAEIKKAWNKLTDDDVNLYESQPDVFFARIKEKHGFARDQAQKRLDSIKEDCGGKCSSGEKAAS